jgi:hypothetical protein
VRGGGHIAIVWDVSETDNRRGIFHFPFVKLISVRCLRCLRSIKHGEEHEKKPTSRRGEGIIETKEGGQTAKE